MGKQAVNKSKKKKVHEHKFNSTNLVKDGFGVSCVIFCEKCGESNYKHY